MTQDYIIGRYACVADAPSHTYTATQYNAPHSIEGNKMTKLMLCGCTMDDAAGLLPLAKSWLRAPRLVSAGLEVPYDVTQRAYIASSSASSFRLEASAEQPACGVCLIIKGVSEVSGVQVDGKLYKEYKAGVHTSWEGPSLVLWLPLQATASVSIDVL